MQKLLSFFVAMILLLFVNATQVAFGQPSLDQKDASIVTIELNGESLTYEIYRDSDDQNQFYYLPNEVRIFERVVNGKRIPEMSMVVFDFANEDNQQAPAGGILQFSAVIGAYPEAIELIRDAIKKQKSLPDDYVVRLASIPLQRSEVLVFSAEGNLITKVFGSGSAPLGSTQKMIFELDLSKAGADVYKALTSGGTGVGVVVKMDFLGLTPAAKIVIEADYRKIRDFYSKNEKEKSAAAACGWSGKVSANASWQSDFSRTIDTLISSGALKVTNRGNETYDSAKLSELVAPILARINQEILNLQKAPEQIDPAVAKDPEANATATGWGLAVAYGKSTSVKEVNEVRDFKEVIDMEFRDPVPRSTSAGGFIGVGRYPEDVKETIYIRATSSFKTGVLALPMLSDSTFESAECNIWVTARNSNTPYYSKVFNWKSGQQWKTLLGNSVSMGMFPFSTLPAELAGTDWRTLKFHYKLVGTTVTGQVLNREESFDVQDGAKSSPRFDEASHPRFLLKWQVLPWATAEVAKIGQFVDVGFQCTQGGKKLAAGSVDVSGSSTNGQAIKSPSPTTVFFDSRGSDVVISATATIKDGEDFIEKRFTRVVSPGSIGDVLFKKGDFQ
jgi:hypothetical protein